MTNDAYDRRADTNRSSYDRTLEMVDGMPNAKLTRPSTTQSIMPIVGDVRTFVVRTSRSSDYGFIVFVEMTGPEGHIRIALPDRVAQSIYRQREALVDRSTPASRARDAARRERTKAKAAKDARKAKRNGGTP